MRPKCRGGLLPLLEDSATSPVMILHAMDVIKNAVNYLNPGQIPVMTCDQPLFAIGKAIQWTWPEQYGEDKLVIILMGVFTLSKQHGVQLEHGLKTVG